MECAFAHDLHPGKLFEEREIIKTIEFLPAFSGAWKLLLHVNVSAETAPKNEGNDMKKQKTATKTATQITEYMMQPVNERELQAEKIVMKKETAQWASTLSILCYLYMCIKINTTILIS